VEAHGGTIRAERREERGATFTVVLPLDRRAGHEVAEPSGVEGEV